MNTQNLRLFLEILDDILNEDEHPLRNKKEKEALLQGLQADAAYFLSEKSIGLKRVGLVHASKKLVDPVDFDQSEVQYSMLPGG